MERNLEVPSKLRQQISLGKEEEKLPRSLYQRLLLQKHCLSGIDFPKTKDSLKEYVHKHISKVDFQDPKAILGVIDQIAARKYHDMAEVEQEIGRIK